jgi:hypothetical protein
MMILLNDDDEGLSEHDDQDTIMTHPLLRKDTDATPAETWVSAMASVNKLVKEGIDNDVLLIFAGEASGVSRYNGLVSARLYIFCANFWLMAFRMISGILMATVRSDWIVKMSASIARSSLRADQRTSSP